MFRRQWFQIPCFKTLDRQIEVRERRIGWWGLSQPRSKPFALSDSADIDDGCTDRTASHVIGGCPHNRDGVGHTFGHHTAKN